MASSPALSGRCIDTARSFTGGVSSETSATAVSEVLLARGLFRNLESESSPSLCFLDCARGPTYYHRTNQSDIRN